MFIWTSQVYKKMFLFLFGLQYGINLSISTLKYVSDTYNPRLISHRLQVAIYFSARFQSFAIKWPRAQAPIHFGLENGIWRQVGPCWRPQLKTISSQHLFKIFELEKEEARTSPFFFTCPPTRRGSLFRSASSGSEQVHDISLRVTAREL